MNNLDFEQHFNSFLKSIGIENYQRKSYRVCPVAEPKKTLSAYDDMMRLLFLPKDRTLSYDEVISLFTWKEGYYPLWITGEETGAEVVLKTSLRMRKAGPNDDKLYYPFRRAEKPGETV